MILSDDQKDAMPLGHGIKPFKILDAVWFLLRMIFFNRELFHKIGRSINNLVQILIKKGKKNEVYKIRICIFTTEGKSFNHIKVLIL